MENEKIRKLWGTSLIVLGVLTVILMGSAMIGVTLPDALRRIIGILDLAAVAVLGYTSVKLPKKK